MDDHHGMDLVSLMEAGFCSFVRRSVCEARVCCMILAWAISSFLSVGALFSTLYYLPTRLACGSGKTWGTSLDCSALQTLSCEWLPFGGWLRFQHGENYGTACNRTAMGVSGQTWYSGVLLALVAGRGED